MMMEGEPPPPALIVYGNVIDLQYLSRIHRLRCFMR